MSLPVKLQGVIETRLNDHGLWLPKPNFTFDGLQERQHIYDVNRAYMKCPVKDAPIGLDSAERV